MKKEYIKIQKNISVPCFLGVLGGTAIIICIVIMCTISALVGGITMICIAFFLLFFTAYLIRNGTISKVVISKKGINIKAKTKQFIFLDWNELTDCEVEHIGRGVYKILLIAEGKSFSIVHGAFVLKKLLMYCSSSAFAEILKIRESEI